MEDFEEKIIENEKSNCTIITAIAIIIAIISMSIFMNVGYAYETNKTSDVKGKFELVFENAQIIEENGIEENTATVKISDDMKNLIVNAGNLKYPGAKVKYKVDIVNYSTVEVKVEDINCDGLKNTKAIKMEGLEKLNENMILKPREKYNLEFSIKWDEEYDEEINETANFNITIDFMQNIG